MHSPRSSKFSTSDIGACLPLEIPTSRVKLKVQVARDEDGHLFRAGVTAARSHPMGEMFV